MTNASVISSILSNFGGATMVRTGDTNFIAIPTGDPEQPYVKVTVGNLLAKDTKNHTAFNFEEAVASYKNWESAKNEKANTPKKEKPVNVEAQARRDALDARITQWFAEEAEAGKAYTATDILMAIDTGDTVMAVGSSAIRLANLGVINMTVENNKRTYTK